ncbi:hypothetical protein TRIP_C21680 [Candidatus Zixiibacteriota bacterium]|nr:hypothetical protein TRIP_C21680 [candidate division Zixibacteria bacterium]
MEAQIRDDWNNISPSADFALFCLESNFSGLVTCWGARGHGKRSQVDFRYLIDIYKVTGIWVCSAKFFSCIPPGKIAVRDLTRNGWEKGTNLHDRLSFEI